MNDDLISRSALKEAIKPLIEDGRIYDILSYIDNAPTVERKPFATVTFDKDELERIVEERVIEPIKNGELVIKEERPTGKWVKIFENPFTNGYVCPFCGHKIQVTEQFLPKVTKCENCGASMIDDRGQATKI
jgi:DNA-directed RNA polymerase subunit RPC12/RpoP